MRKFVHNLNPILKLLLFSYVTHRYQNGGNKEINNKSGWMNRALHSIVQCIIVDGWTEHFTLYFNA